MKAAKAPAARPSCASCSRELAELLRDEGLGFDEAQALARSKSLMARAGDGWKCRRCGTGAKKSKAKVAGTFRNRPMPTLAEIAANSARQVAEEALRSERRRTAREARRAAR